MNKSLVNELAALFYPHACVVCGAELLENEGGVCLKCLYQLPRTHNYLERENEAEQHMAARISFERIATYCVYSKGGMLEPLIHHLKYHGKKEIGLLLGRLFGRDLLGSDFLNSIDWIVPVPLHPKREKERGYNQAEMIARGLSEATSLPVLTGNLVRVIFNPTQTKRTKTQRWENVKGIFEVVDSSLFEGKHLLLVDDVITTGSTIEACGLALQACKGVKISIATLGQVL
ncbi:MAG TPA: ComF family protein [Bacteroidales bacterium]|nr:ComF family protein [Bacteroidales bacterium]